MPHEPVYFNKNGERYPFLGSLHDAATRKNQYLEYLQFSNKKYLEIIGNILKNSKRPPVIVFLSDHGSRLFEKEEEKKPEFSTINAIYIPNRNYEQFYEGMSNVNTLRVLLNTIFQSLPVLEDKSLYLQAE